MGLAGIAAAGTIGKFVSRGNLQGAFKTLLPVRRAARRLMQQEALERVPDTGKTQATRRKVRQLGRLTPELNDQVVGHHRGQQFLLEHVNALGSNVLGVQHDLDVSNIVLHIVAI